MALEMGSNFQILNDLKRKTSLTEFSNAILH